MPFRRIPCQLANYIASTSTPQDRIGKLILVILPAASIYHFWHELVRERVGTHLVGTRMQLRRPSHVSTHLHRVHHMHMATVHGGQDQPDLQCMTMVFFHFFFADLILSTVFENKNNCPCDNVKYIHTLAA